MILFYRESTEARQETALDFIRGSRCEQPIQVFWQETWAAEELFGLRLREAGEARRLKEGGGAVGAFGKFCQGRRSRGFERETQEHGGENALLHRFVGHAYDGFEWRNHIADHIFRRVVQEDKEACLTRQLGIEVQRDRIDEQRVLSNRENIRATGLTVPASDTGEDVRDILDLDVERRWIEKIEAAPRQHALPGARRARDRHSGFSLPIADAMPPAIDEMIVDHADRLHEGVDDCRSAEFEAARFQVFRDFA